MSLFHQLTLKICGFGIRVAGRRDRRACVIGNAATNSNWSERTICSILLKMQTTLLLPVARREGWRGVVYVKLDSADVQEPT